MQCIFELSLHFFHFFCSLFAVRRIQSGLHLNGIWFGLYLYRIMQHCHFDRKLMISNMILGEKPKKWDIVCVWHEHSTQHTIRNTAHLLCMLFLLPSLFILYFGSLLYLDLWSDQTNSIGSCSSGVHYVSNNNGLSWKCNEAEESRKKAVCLEKQTNFKRAQTHFSNFLKIPLPVT